MKGQQVKKLHILSVKAGGAKRHDAQPRSRRGIRYGLQTCEHCGAGCYDIVNNKHMLSLKYRLHFRDYFIYSHSIAQSLGRIVARLRLMPAHGLKTVAYGYSGDIADPEGYLFALIITSAAKSRTMKRNRDNHVDAVEKAVGSNLACIRGRCTATD